MLANGDVVVTGLLFFTFLIWQCLIMYEEDEHRGLVVYDEHWGRELDYVNL